MRFEPGQDSPVACTSQRSNPLGHRAPESVLCRAVASRLDKNPKKYASSDRARNHYSLQLDQQAYNGRGSWPVVGLLDKIGRGQKIDRRRIDVGITEEQHIMLFHADGSRLPWDGASIGPLYTHLPAMVQCAADELGNGLLKSHPRIIVNPVDGCRESYASDSNRHRCQPG